MNKFINSTCTCIIMSRAFLGKLCKFETALHKLMVAKMSTNLETV